MMEDERDYGDGRREGRVHVWSARLRGYLFSLPELVQVVALSPDGARIATGSAGGALRIWDATRGTMLKELKTGWDDFASVLFARDGRTVLAAGLACWVSWCGTPTRG